MQSIETKRKMVDKINTERAKRTDQQQLARLDDINGVGKGAKRERAKLIRRIEAAKAAEVQQKADKAAEIAKKAVKR